MSDNHTDNSRRRFIRIGVLGAVAAPFSHLLLQEQARAQDLAKLDENDPQAKALNYVHDAAESNRPSPDQNCANCQLYTGDPGAEWGPCQIFPGKSVKAAGWCSAWVKKAG